MDAMDSGSNSAVLTDSSPPPATNQVNHTSSSPMSHRVPGRIHSSWLKQISSEIVKDMRRYGLSVVDNLYARLGLQTLSESILNEVTNLYQKNPRVFRDGGLVRDVLPSNELVRSDKVVWFKGNENYCRNINFLIRTIDTIVSMCSMITEEVPNPMKDCNIRSRTKAMVACYPGNQSRYVKHVDNPQGDGRCITCIYYLNKNWKEEDGGILRLFPTSMSEVAIIEPHFDRLILFWSDRRNPHEVLPSNSIRFAITIWYYSHEERQKHVERFIQQNGRLPSSDCELQPFMNLIHPNNSR